MSDVETRLILSNAAKCTLLLETDHAVRDVEALADEFHGFNDVLLKDRRKLVLMLRETPLERRGPHPARRRRG